MTEPAQPGLFFHCPKCAGGTIAEGTQYTPTSTIRRRKCRKCSYQFDTIEVPTNPDGSPHWATCPAAKEFKQG